ncbi:type VII secretion target [Micromonospora olivasterospora]|uniref:Excreted virulence factor EspC (Type VII ESX diderm) n=1 Tax=Micromonospora olivasterospora TaxID=1880 RepID=A0A562IGZ2_MICOL|nr:type VII secretion target [Micromonospora olivasterospora]TWH69995.1 excreted virulence factor EspC (type VII ESX diderm) [Micromonospora olivasterospora]
MEVDAWSLRAHSSAVDDCADAVERCRHAASTIELGRAAYGRLCQMIPHLLEPVHEAVVDSLGETACEMQRAADALRAVADRYDQGDQRAAIRFGGGER